MDTAEEADICRVCRSEGTQEKPLYHPCVCTGSIKFIHQECLLQWLKHSRKEYCELCKHRFAFTPISCCPRDPGKASSLTFCLLIWIKVFHVFIQV
uniref:E3 ubiquitin-protein ligase MARCHF6 n=1 Tax=Poecilia reticulata TaxID=8081 RepID=A0A3P9PSZ0_POERE